MSTPDPRIDKLPKWAQDHIRRLEMNLATAEARVNAEANPLSAVLAEPYSDPPQGVGEDGDNIQFVLSRRDDDSPFDYIMVRLDGQRLYVHASDSFSVFPQSSNTAYLKLGRP